MTRFSVRKQLSTSNKLLAIRHRAEGCCVKRSGKLKLKQRRKGLNLLACTVCKWDYSQLNCIIYVHNNSIVITGLKLNYTIISISKWLVKVENKYPILLMNICNHRGDWVKTSKTNMCFGEGAAFLSQTSRQSVCVCAGLPGDPHTQDIFPKLHEIKDPISHSCHFRSSSIKC